MEQEPTGVNDNAKPNEQSNKKGKDSVFIDLFHQPKYALSLVQALNPKLNLTEEDIEFVTLHSVLMVKPYNDLGLLVKDSLLICSEAQSTWSLNVLVRSKNAQRRLATLCHYCLVKKK